MALRLCPGGLRMCSQIILKRCWPSLPLLGILASQARPKQVEWNEQMHCQTRYVKLAQHTVSIHTSRVTVNAHEMDMQAALEILEQSLSKAPLALTAAKAAVDDGFEVPLPKGLIFERAHYAQLFHTKDRLEALKAFAEKRKPNFEGC